MQAARPNATPIDVIEHASVENAVVPVLQHPEVVLSEVKVLATPLQPLMLPVTPIYSLLAEVVDAVANPRDAAARAGPVTIVGNSAQALSRPTRRRPRPAGRAALAAISPT